ncbi:MAG: EAL domain-containing response regulator [Usitatibacter sp.]
MAELRFLVVEDHDFQRWVLGSMLKRLGARYVFQASDGREALEIFRSLEPQIDIIVSDLDMPAMDGLEFMRHVGEAGTNVSVIVASALDPSLVASVENMARAYGVDLLGAIQKPFTSPKLEHLIARRGTTAAKSPRASKPAPVFSIAEMIEGLDNDEFEPFFQPKVEVATGRLAGAEALARWRHPRKGVVPPFVPPYAFIKPFEDNGQIDRLTWIMLDKAAKSCREWRRAGANVTVSVNLSLQTLADMTLADRVAQLVRDRGLEPRDVVLEVTESARLAHLGNALENLSRLRMKGFGLSIDDYGTGYSSLQQLSRIAFTEIKIDGSFLRSASTQDAGLVVLESSLAMARKLKISAVAEGVETESDWRLLDRLGCDLAQGYFIGMPLPGEDFLDWARKRR